MAQDFFDLLYNGYTGEYQLMSSLYRNGLDALRPPADMGIDVVSLNLKQQLEHPGMAPETFFFQVKTAVTNVSEAADRPGAIATVATSALSAARDTRQTTRRTTIAWSAISSTRAAARVSPRSRTLRRNRRGNLPSSWLLGRKGLACCAR